MTRQEPLTPLGLLVLMILDMTRDDFKILEVQDKDGQMIVETAVARLDEVFEFRRQPDGERYVWSVDLAHEIVRRDEVIAEMIDTSQCAAMITSKLIEINEDKLNCITPESLARPIIIVELSNGDGCLIDGWHRVAFAAYHGVFELPAYLLHKRQELECRIIGEGINRMEESKGIYDG